ncbi:hypothetical protein [Paenibacillus larvae]|uniref:DksA C4-type domain-containing protein n=2 Tax=root TaxID=1 RepID=A0A2I7SC36_9CAUD|nr:hypothetical protein [Paenibacillus larvae]YP_010080218.1 hypothetical protein KMC72_gp68 [Paenibacillus phage Dragolir]AUS03463.1 hypothetical protein DRAGOLIR_66 [Paenibacillus phage Dragolir]ETK27202.1 hypothetical protein ERIC1_1c06440 [Paenibacillus larvae subsp. larvae DSM 25719]MCY9563245.1 hypothetical protein [Paenibacillus larvae]MCY9569055.1 hypothetical protein [Paenibacillus larvae]MCY9571924.1 hypothetical protein [Paenibacillus larvae]
MGKDRLFQRLNIAERDQGFEYYVDELLEEECLEGGAVIGIAKQIVSKGVPSLSELQLRTFINHGIWEHYYLEECGRCGEEIPWSEMRFALEHGNCSYCQHKIDKDE